MASTHQPCRTVVLPVLHCRRVQIHRTEQSKMACWHRLTLLRNCLISNTQTIAPSTLGKTEEERTDTLVGVMDGYFSRGAHHLNVNVFGVEKLIDAMEHPEKEEYANFTIRVSGYAVKFIDLTREQQEDVIARRAHGKM